MSRQVFLFAAAAFLHTGFAVAEPAELRQQIEALPACASVPAGARCRENASASTFRIEVALPGAMTEALTPDGTLLLRQRNTANSVLSTAYDFYDGLAPGDPENPLSTTAVDETKSGLLRGVESLLGSLSIGGTTNTRDAAKRISTASDLGLGNRSSLWDYDGRGRLEKSLLFAPADEAEELQRVTETLLSADFRAGRGARGILSQPQQTLLGTELSLRLEPPKWTAEPNDAHQLVNRKIFLGDEMVSTLTYVFEHGRRKASGSWASAYDEFGRLVSIESAEEGRRVSFVYDPNDRIVGRTAYQSTDNGGWVLETRTNVLARDGLPAETTWVWDPFTDRLVAIFEAGKSRGEQVPPAAGLLRQYVHGDQGYDDPVEILVKEEAGVVRYLPIVDTAGSGSLQAVVRGDGVIVERVLYGDSYGDAPKYLQGPVVDEISYEVKKDGSGNVARVTVRAHLTEKIVEATAATALVFTSYDSEDQPVVELSEAVEIDADDPYTLVRTFSAAEWSSVTATPAEVIQIAVTGTVRAHGWGETPVAPAPEWAQTLYGTHTSSDRPVAHRESLTSVTDFVASIPPGEAKSKQLYEIADIYMAAADESRSKLLTAFKAAPYTENAARLVYLRDRWYDPSTGSWLTPDAESYSAGSSNLYAGFNLDPVNNEDPNGRSATFVGGAIGFAWGVGWGLGSSVNDCVFWDACKGAGHYLGQVGMFAISGAEIGAAVDLAAVGGGSLSATLGGAGFDSAIAAFSGDWSEYGKSQVRGAAIGLGAWAAARGVAAVPGVAAAGEWIASTAAVRGSVSLLGAAAERTGLGYFANELGRLSTEHGFERYLLANGGSVNKAVGGGNVLDAAGDFYRGWRVKSLTRTATQEIDTAIAAGDRVALQNLGARRGEINQILGGGSGDRFRGTVIDRLVKNRLQDAVGFGAIQITGPFRYGPDLWNPRTMRAWDITTPGQWQRHVNQYVLNPPSARPQWRSIVGAFTK